MIETTADAKMNLTGLRDDIVHELQVMCDGNVGHRFTKQGELFEFSHGKKSYRVQLATPKEKDFPNSYRPEGTGEFCWRDNASCTAAWLLECQRMLVELFRLVRAKRTAIEAKITSVNREFR